MKRTNHLDGRDLMKSLGGLIGACCVLALLAGCGGGGGDNGPSTSTVTGTLVADSGGQALVGYTVNVQGASPSATTDSSGNFRVQNVPDGPQTLVFMTPSGVQIGTYTIANVDGRADNVGVIKIEGGPPPQPPLIRCTQ